VRACGAQPVALTSRNESSRVMSRSRRCFLPPLLIFRVGVDVDGDSGLADWLLPLLDDEEELNTRPHIEGIVNVCVWLLVVCCSCRWVALGQNVVVGVDECQCGQLSIFGAKIRIARFQHTVGGKKNDSNGSMGHTKTASREEGGVSLLEFTSLLHPPHSLAPATVRRHLGLTSCSTARVSSLADKEALHRGAHTHAQQVSWRGETCVARRHAMRASLSFVHVTCVNTVQENDPMLPWRHCIDGGCQAFALICVCIERSASELDHQPHSHTRASTHSEHITLRHSAFLCSVAHHRSAPILHPEV
jgi:hypothetical protein